MDLFIPNLALNEFNKILIIFFFKKPLPKDVESADRTRSRIGYVLLVIEWLGNYEGGLNLDLDKRKYRTCLIATKKQKCQ